MLPESLKGVRLTNFIYLFIYLFIYQLSGHRPAQRECARTDSGPTRGAIPTQSHNP